MVLDPRNIRVRPKLSESAITVSANHRISRSAAELDELFERKIKPWRFHKTETATQRMVDINKAEE